MKPMLAATVKDIESLRYPLFASPKLDGIRALVYHGALLSRSFKPIPNQVVQDMFGKLPHGLDGELIVGMRRGEGVFQRTSSQIMSQAGGAENVSFWCFDNFSEAKPFIERLKTVPEKHLHIHTRMYSAKELAVYEESCVKHGFEGVILRDPAGLYKQGRSTLREQGMMKLKQFLDDEARVLGVTELHSNQNAAFEGELGQTKRSSHQANQIPMGTLGALIVHWKGKQFQIGTGFTAEQRAQLWKENPTGRMAKFKYLPVGMKDLPRHPVFLGFRDERD